MKDRSGPLKDSFRTPCGFLELEGSLQFFCRLLPKVLDGFCITSGSLKDSWRSPQAIFNEKSFQTLQGFLNKSSRNDSSVFDNSVRVAEDAFKIMPPIPVGFLEDFLENPQVLLEET